MFNKFQLDNDGWHCGIDTNNEAEPHDDHFTTVDAKRHPKTTKMDLGSSSDCDRRFNRKHGVALVYGKGVASPSGLANDVERRFDYTVRQPFAASFTCERENAKAPCTPLRPVRLEFNAPIARADAEKIRVNGPNGSIAPTFAPDDKDTETSTVEFAAPLPEHADLT